MVAWVDHRRMLPTRSIIQADVDLQDNDSQFSLPLSGANRKELKSNSKTWYYKRPCQRVIFSRGYVTVLRMFRKLPRCKLR